MIHWLIPILTLMRLFYLKREKQNIGFQLLIILLFPLILWIAGFETKSTKLFFLLLLLIFGLFICFTLLSLLLSFICYECLIIILFFSLFLFIPSFYRIRTAFFSFLFSIFGSLSSILSNIIFIFCNSIFSIPIIIPFFIKIPSFPFFYRLPEVHCEANTSISLSSAGLFSKISIYGILRFILSSFFLALRFRSSFVLSFTLIGIILVSASCFRYYDLKKIIAFSSILHLNITLCALYSLSGTGLLSSILISLSHAFSSIGLSLYCGLLILWTYSRYIDSLFYLSSTMRGVLLLFILANLSFPGTLNFIGEVTALIAIVSIDTFSILSSSFYWISFCIIWNSTIPL